MHNMFFNSVISSSVDLKSFLICSVVSILVGFTAAGTYMFKSRYTQSFVTTVALIPIIVQVVIMMVNGNIGVGVAVAGAFSLVRFRSIAGSAKEIGTIFLVMAAGLATGTGYVGIAVLLVVIVSLLQIAFTCSGFGKIKREEKELKITIPESLDYTNLFDDIFEKYARTSELVKVKTSNMGSLYQLSYRIEMKHDVSEKEMLDDIRCRNGNLDIICGKVAMGKEEL